jgi:hypothetical protein
MRAIPHTQNLLLTFNYFKMSVPQAPSSNGFLRSGREFQKFIMEMEYNTPVQEMIYAIINASAENNVLTADEFRYGPGQLRQVKISYYPQRCDVVADECDNSICEVGEVQQPIQQWYTISKCIQTKPQRLYPNDVRYIDGSWSFSMNAAQQIRASIGAVMQELATRLTTDLLAHKGLHLGGSEYGTRINLVNTTDGLLTPIGFSTISQEFARLAYRNPYIVGSGQVFTYRQFFNIAAPNTNLGQDFTKAAIPNLYFDVNLDTIKGTQPGDPESIIAFDPRAVKMVSFSENAGRWSTDVTSLDGNALDTMFKNGNESVMLGTFVVPGYPIMMDLDVHKTICVEGSKTGAFDWKLTLIYDVFYTPIQTCNEQGINGIFEYLTCPAVIPVCPTGDEPSPNPTSSTFNWNPGDVFPLLVSDITIGDNTNYPGATVANRAELAQLLGAAYNGQYIFSVSGSNIQYTGFSALTGSINNGDITITFA